MSEIINIPLGGVSNEPDDYNAEDGGLSVSINAVKHHGSLRPVMPGSPVEDIGELPANTDVVAIHEVGGMKHYILAMSPEEGESTLLYIDAKAEDKTAKEIAKYASKIAGVSAIGNVLTVWRQDGLLSYAMWREGNYAVLGHDLPLLKASPYLRSTVASADKHGAMFEGKWNFDESLIALNGTSYQSALKSFLVGKQSVVFTEEQRKDLSDRIFAAINSAHRSLSEEGYFYAPFFVRFALRMYDGNHIMHTPPMLMIAGAAGKPITGVTYLSEDEERYSYFQQLVFCASRLCADIDIERLEQWKDLVTHVDVFVSAPIVDYSDGADALKGIGLANIPYSNENGPVTNTSLLPEYNPLYMKDKKVTGNLYEDYLAQTKNPFYRSSTQVLCGYHKRLDSGIRKKVFMLIRNAGDYAISTGGNKVTPTQANEGNVLGTTKDGTQYTLGDVGIRDLTEYSYIETDEEGGLSELRITSVSGTVISADIIFVGIYDRERDTSIYAMFQIENTTENGYSESIISNNTFYLVKSIPADEVKNGWRGDLYVPRNVLPSLTTREHLDDGGQMRTSIRLEIPPFTYNNRLSHVIQSRTLPVSSEIADFCIGPSGNQSWSVERAWIKAEANGQTVYRKLDAGREQHEVHAEDIVYFYYPDHDATHLIMSTTESGYEEGAYQVRVYALQKHSLLNGVYLWNEYKHVPPSRIATYESLGEMENDPDIQAATNGATKVVYGNLVRVSGVSNPFYVNEVNQVQLPSGNIMGLSTTAKALSQGQFGAFPLYCFSDNGIWALEVSDEGTYSAKQPVSRAVCTSPESITQTDGEVLFVTKRGLMSISGSETSCISEVLSGHNYTSKISKLAEVMNHVGMQNVEIPTHVEDWMQEAKILYDDMRQYIYAFRDDDTLGYIYSMSDKAWGMFLHDLAHPLPCYTDALAVTNPDEGGIRKLINLSDYTNCGSAPKSLIITRPLAMGVPDGYKTLEALITRGMLDKDDAHLVVWASNNLKDWAVVATSQTSWYRGASGSPYKYYRIGILLDNWEEEDSISMLSADVTPRLNNRLR